MIPWWRIDFGKKEIERIASSINDENISQGPVTREFEKLLAKEIGVKYVASTTSGSMAILMALIAAKIGPGDEVIVPNRTWIATAHAPLLLGAKTVLVDVEKEFPIIDINEVEAAITSRTKAIIPVHLNGKSADTRRLNDIAGKYNLKIIEDAAQAFGSKNEDGFLGTQSYAGCFSLSVAKIIATGQGGFVVTNDSTTYSKINLMRTQGIDDLINCNFNNFGFNFRFNDILASIGIEQLLKIDVHIKRVKQINELYLDGLKGLDSIKLIYKESYCDQIPIYVEILSDRRDELIEYLSNYNIQSRPFYPNLDSAPHLKSDRTFQNSEKFCNKGLFLPSGPGQSIENINTVIDYIHKFEKGI